MERSFLFFADRCLEIVYPALFQATFTFLFRTVTRQEADETADHCFVVERTDEDEWLLHKDGSCIDRVADQPAMANLLMG